jgi:hypothetical protein
MSSLWQRFYKGKYNMKLTSMIEKEEHLVEEKLRFYRMVNGLLAGAFFIGCAIAIYKVVGLFF